MNLLAVQPPVPRLPLGSLSHLHPTKPTGSSRVWCDADDNNTEPPATTPGDYCCSTRPCPHSIVTDITALYERLERNGARRRARS